MCCLLLQYIRAAGERSGGAKVKGDFFGLSIKSTVDACPYVRRTDVKVLAKPRGPHIFKSESHSSSSQ
jgi:hypothetical protein